MTDQLDGSPAIAETPVAETPVETVDPAPTEETPKPSKIEIDKDEFEGRISKLTRARYDEAYRADTAEARLQRLEAELAEARTAKPQSVAPTTYPKLADYGFDETAHQAAVAEYVAAKASEEVKSAFQKERERTATEASEKTFSERQARFAAAKPDYADKVLRNPVLPITPDMAKVLRKNDMGPEIAYYLAENLEEANSIAQLDPLDQAVEIGLIKAKLKSAAQPASVPSVSKTPAPPPTIKGETPAFTIKADSAESDQLSDAEWAKRRAKQVEKQRS